MNAEDFVYYKEEITLTRYENEKLRKLVDMAIRNQDPSYRVTPDEEIVDISEGEKG